MADQTGVRFFLGGGFCFNPPGEGLHDQPFACADK